jgi:hypothetical protein
MLSVGPDDGVGWGVDVGMDQILEAIRSAA